MSAEGSADARVYIGNLGWDVTSDELREHMSAAGTVVKANILQGNNGRSRGCGIVEFASEADAQNAKAILNDTEIKGRKIFVREDREAANPKSTGAAKAPRTESIPAPSSSASRTIIVSNIPVNATWQDLKNFMRSAGAIIRADVFTGADGESTGVGSVEFKFADGVANGLALNGTLFNGITIQVRLATEDDKIPAPTRPVIRGRRVYVGQLAWSVAWQDLKDHFKPIGNILRADVATESGSRRSKGFGFVEFEEAADAERAIAELNDSLLHGRRIYVREDREQK